MKRSHDGAKRNCLTPSEIHLARGEDQWTAAYMAFSTHEIPRRTVEGRDLNLYQLYQEVAKRGGMYGVIKRGDMDQVSHALGLGAKSGQQLRLIFGKLLSRFQAWEMRHEIIPYPSRVANATECECMVLRLNRGQDAWTVDYVSFLAPCRGCWRGKL